MDVGALAEGRLAELINLVPLGGLELALAPAAAAGVTGWDGLGAVLARYWLTDIARNQVGGAGGGVYIHNCIRREGVARVRGRGAGGGGGGYASWVVAV